MTNIWIKNTIVLVGIGLILTACTDQTPYIHNAAEFDRENPNFAKKLKDRETVEICYVKRATTPKLLLQMATDECRRFGKRAVFREHKTLACSISAPAQAVFDCIGPDSELKK
jgi:hypothetical protein